LFVAPCDKVGELVSIGAIMPVEDADYVTDTVLASCLKAATYDDVIYGYPVSDETYALYYNKALISEDEVPKTWEEMIDYAASHTSDGNYGFVMDPTTGYYTIIFATSDGNRLFGPDGTDATATYLNTPEAVKGLSLLGELADALKISSSDLNTQISDELFSTGKAAMTISGPWNTSVFADAGIDYGVTTLPSLPGETTPAVSFSGARMMFVSAYSEHQKEAADFAEFLMTDEMQQMRYEYLKCIPAVEVSLEDEAIEAFMEQLEYATPMPSIPQMSSFWDSMSSASKNIWDGADVQSAMDKCDKAILKSTAD
jgi:arabinogalactan oligomer/maltooligosaccharide transport system substrate-binding protein